MNGKDGVKFHTFFLIQAHVCIEKKKRKQFFFVIYRKTTANSRGLSVYDVFGQ